jgi:hypothetical protein
VYAVERLHDVVSEMSCYYCQPDPCVCRFTQPEAKQPITARHAAMSATIPAPIVSSCSDFEITIPHLVEDNTAGKWLKLEPAWVFGSDRTADPIFDSLKKQIDEAMAEERRRHYDQSLRLYYDRPAAWSLASGPAIREHVNVMRERAMAETGFVNSELGHDDDDDDDDDDCDCDEDDND